MFSSSAPASTDCINSTAFARRASTLISSKQVQALAAFGTRTAIRVHASTPTCRTTSSRSRLCGATGTGPSGSRVRKSCAATLTTPLTHSTCGATFVSTRKSRLLVSTKNVAGGLSRRRQARSSRNTSCCAPASRQSRIFPTSLASTTSTARVSTRRSGPTEVSPSMTSGSAWSAQEPVQFRSCKKQVEPRLS